MIERLPYSLRNKILSSGFFRSHFKNLRNKYLNKEFLLSEEYKDLFTRRVKDQYKFDADINDAEELTPNFKFRHFYFNRALGSWRWKGVYQNRELLSKYIFDENLKGIDFGGAYGPISKNTHIVDFSERDIFGRDVEIKSLDQVDFKIDYLFSSHTFEHIQELNQTLNQVKEMMNPEGQLFLNLPSYSCKRWRSGIHTNKKFNDHKWTFYLSGDNKALEEISDNNPLAIDETVEQFFEIQKAEYVGDNSIFIHANN